MRRSASSSRAPLLPPRLSLSRRWPGRRRGAQTPVLSLTGVRSKDRTLSHHRSAADTAAAVCLGPGGRGR
ncbi:hypothetical protein NDU88_004997 [Pleurodeles waltl]|uniref:Uncharacterized protein n=1 Tax=Pleurodeles waltl TaxID=8319 RepID=A0AAV7VHS7_PLEWA|nr:hypothetical protein NDU88_004997 [Pleurodeles waltl]